MHGGPLRETVTPRRPGRRISRPWPVPPGRRTTRTDQFDRRPGIVNSRYALRSRRPYREEMPTWQRPEPPARWLRMTQPAFVGRRTQFDALEEAWAGVTEGVRHAVFVGAEAGGGKTRFVVEAALALHAEGAGIVWGACSQDMGLAHDPFVEPVATLLGALVPDAEQPALSEATLDRLRTLTASRGWDASDADDLLRSELYSSVVEALAWAASVRPVVLVLEDLHWAGQAARDLLRYVVSRTDDQQLLMLATMRNTPPDRSSGLSETVSELYRLEGVQRLDLPSLDVGEITTYLERNRFLAGGEARHAAAVMRDTTGGNPFLLRET